MLSTIQMFSPPLCSSVQSVPGRSLPVPTDTVSLFRDVQEIRSCFPIFQNSSHKIFFDNASTTQKPNDVIAAINKFYNSDCANSGRGSYSWSTKLTRAVEESRETLAEFIGCEPDQLAFTHGATDSLNLVATNWGLHNLHDGDEVMVCPDDHLSAVLPWYNLAAVLKRFNVSISIVPFKMHPSGTYDRRSISNCISSKTRLIALTHIHHVYGMEMDLPELKALIPQEVLISLDVSQSVGHIPINVTDLGVDFVSFSGHKMFASNGIGCLWTSDRSLAQLWPMRVGAKTELRQTDSGLELDSAKLAKVIECGTLNLPGILSLSAAVRFMQQVDLTEAANHCSELTKYLVGKLRTVPGLEFAPGIGSCDCTRGYGIVSFRIDELRSADIGAFLDSEGIFVRTGDHCRARESEGADFIRVSLQMYNTQDEVDRFVEVLNECC
jgi:cysteine desulfurase / selenocysteine lyase